MRSTVPGHFSEEKSGRSSDQGEKLKSKDTVTRLAIIATATGGVFEITGLPRNRQ